jgi:hypothetical protein
MQLVRVGNIPDTNIIKRRKKGTKKNVFLRRHSMSGNWEKMEKLRQRQNEIDELRNEEQHDGLGRFALFFCKKLGQKHCCWNFVFPTRIAHTANVIPAV